MEEPGWAVQGHYRYHPCERCRHGHREDAFACHTAVVDKSRTHAGLSVVQVQAIVHTYVRGMYIPGILALYRSIILLAVDSRVTQHTGAFHLGFNMFALINFGPSVAQSSPFNGSGSHFLAFYLSAGLLSSLGSHLSTLIFKNSRFTPGMGASGAIFGVFSAWAMTHQETKVRVFPFPKVFAARELLEYEVGFELLGLLGLWRALRIPINWGHAAHLGGLGAGLAYVTYAGKGQVWNTSRRAAFRSMKLLRMV